MKLKVFLLALTFFFVFKTAVYADNEAAASACLKSNSLPETFEGEDKRALKLEKFLNSYNSPFGEEEVEAFLSAADKNQLDWRLLPAISGIESTFGRFLPFESYNPFGWGIYGNNVRGFSSYEESIDTVAQGIAQNYPYEDINRLASKYCPPNAGLWANKVTALMGQIENTPIDSQGLLVITL